MKRWNEWLTLAGTVVGAAVIIYGVVRFFIDGLVIPLLISVAIVIVGPLENILTNWVRRQASNPEKADVQATFIDRATSLAFIVLLGIVVLLAR